MVDGWVRERKRGREEVKKYKVKLNHNNSEETSALRGGES